MQDVEAGRFADDDAMDHFDMGGGDDAFGYGGDDDGVPEMPADTSFGSYIDAGVGKNSMGGEEFALGAVNDIQADANASVHVDAAGNKWHPHTTKVLGMLRNNMEGEKSLSFTTLSEGCSRRTAAGVFFELLQLKTWDYIDVNQADAYGDITVAPGVKFNDEAGAVTA